MDKEWVSDMNSDKDYLVSTDQVKGVCPGIYKLWVVFKLLEMGICFPYSKNRESEYVLIADLIIF